jgi:glycerophosphoryl diester phosphodiesterase
MTVVKSRIRTAPTRRVTAQLIGPAGWLADHSEIVTEVEATSAGDGTYQLELTPNAEVAGSGSYWRIAENVPGHHAHYAVVPVSTDPVWLDDIEVDPATREPLPGPVASMYLERAELGVPGGVAQLNADGTVDAEPTPVGWADVTGKPTTFPPSAGDAFQRVTVASWEAARPAPYLIVHRGGGDVFPECSMEGYDNAVALRAQVVEVSVAMTADGVLVVNHDLDWDRTVNLAGLISTTPSPVALNYAKISKAAQCGPYWEDAPPHVVAFEDILRRHGGKLVLCCEAKADAAYPAMVAMIERYGLKDSVIIKAFHTSPRIDQARAAGYKTFVYLGNPDISQATIDAAAAHADYLVIPAYTLAGDGFGIQDASVVAMAVATGRPVWAWPVHRRSDADRLVALGVQGIVTASYGYVSTSTRLLTASRWATRMIAPGEVAINQADAQYAVDLTAAGVLRLDRVVASGNLPQFLGLGTYCPTPASGYTVDFEVCWEVLPVDSTNKLIWLAWGRGDDRYYQPGYTSGAPGNHAYVRLTGAIGLNRHADTGATNGVAAEVPTSALVAGQWVPLRLAVTPTQATLTRLDGTPVSVTWVDATNRGGYLHIGKTSGDGVLAVRNLVVT